MIRFKIFENFNGSEPFWRNFFLSIDMMIVQYVNAARKAHLLTNISSDLKFWVRGIIIQQFVPTVSHLMKFSPLKWPLDVMREDFNLSLFICSHTKALNFSQSFRQKWAAGEKTVKVKLRHTHQEIDLWKIYSH